MILENWNATWKFVCVEDIRDKKEPEENSCPYCKGNLWPKKDNFSVIFKNDKNHILNFYFEIIFMKNESVVFLVVAATATKKNNLYYLLRD